MLFEQLVFFLILIAYFAPFSYFARSLLIPSVSLLRQRRWAVTGLGDSPRDPVRHPWRQPQIPSVPIGFLRSFSHFYWFLADLFTRHRIFYFLRTFLSPSLYISLSPSLVLADAVLVAKCYLDLKEPVLRGFSEEEYAAGHENFVSTPNT